MAATLVFATLFFCVCSSESVTESPAVQNTFIEVNLGEPNIVENRQAPTETAPATVDDPVIDAPAEIPNPIVADVDPLGQIEPMFVEEVEMATEAEPEFAETAPKAETTGPIAKPAEVVPSVIIEDVKITGDDAPVVEPQPAVAKLDAGNQEMPNAGPVAELGATVKPDTEAVPRAVIGAEQKAHEASDIDPSAESAGPTKDDAVELPVIENAGIIPSPQPEPVEMPISEPATTTTSPGVEPLQVIEPVVVGEAEIITAPHNQVFEEVLSPNPETDEPVTGSSKTGESVVDDAESMQDESSKSDDGLQSDSFPDL